MLFISLRKSYVQTQVTEFKLSARAVDDFSSKARPQQISLEHFQRFFRRAALAHSNAELQAALYAADERLHARRTETESKSRSGRLRLSDRMQLQKLVIMEETQAAAAKGSAQMAQRLRGQHTLCVVHGLRALPRRPTYPLFWRHWTFHAIERPRRE